MLPLLMLMLATEPEAMVDTARRLTAADPGCRKSADSTDITVCGLRNADRFRVPFVGYDPGDPRAESVSGERNRLLAKTDNCQERRAILVGCGFVGAHMTTSARGTSVTGARKLAP
ncbi:hypothetical protein GCM10011380_27870 [Sphingomonas metalli]|jgi:hypothetical protein|uniref:Uncharacterized protein n=1 Tax=Sphingomonas metalli TaxID=1779358 RepID=A0A916WX88_9SPHN|nr:hypothetical protein [Sphingomonas metalli]GGB36908.1 hypothetical protein GCM10011380_27870 [Sphingomonas metalli]